MDDNRREDILDTVVFSEMSYFPFPSYMWPFFESYILLDNSPSESFIIY